MVHFIYVIVALIVGILIGHLLDANQNYRL